MPDLLVCILWWPAQFHPFYSEIKRVGRVVTIVVGILVGIALGNIAGSVAGALALLAVVYVLSAVIFALDNIHGPTRHPDFVMPTLMTSWGAILGLAFVAFRFAWIAPK